MNWDQLILRAIVPISFVAIWALTALFNRESKGFPARPPGPNPQGRPRPGDPPMRWTTDGNPPQPMNRRPPADDADILILSGYPGAGSRAPSARPPQGSAARRQPRNRPAPPASRKVEPVVTRPKQAGVNQNVNQSIARTLDLAPLTAIAPMVTSSTTLANAPSSPAKSTAVVTTATIRPLMNDPARLREAFIVNELFQPPLALRGRRGHHG